MAFVNEQGGSWDVRAGADSTNRRAALITLAIAAVSIVGLVVFGVMNTVGTADTTDTTDGGSPVAAGAGSAGSAEAGPGASDRSRLGEAAMSKDEIAAVAGTGSLSGVRLPLLMDTAAGAGTETGAGTEGGAGAVVGEGTQLIDMTQVLGGKATVVNVWAWNCAPCRQELPLLQQWAKDNPDVQVITVHAATEVSRGQSFLREIGIDLPTYSDTVDAVGSALNLPRVVPVTVIFGPDGKVATMHPGEFTNAQQITTVVRGALK